MKHTVDPKDFSETKRLSVDCETSDIKLFDIQFSATDILRKQGISVDGSQVMQSDECV
jgi:hypothetical protein